MTSKLYDIAYIKTFSHRHFNSNEHQHICTIKFFLDFSKTYFNIKRYLNDKKLRKIPPN